MVLYLLGRNLPLYMFICISSLKDLVVKGIVYLHFRMNEVVLIGVDRMYVRT